MEAELYKKLGLKKLINAKGFITALGGSLMPKEVLRAMEEAATAYVSIAELREKAGQAIARATGAEAGCITTGAAGGIVLATAACMTGTDLIKIERLPDTSGILKNEVIVQANHYIRYICMLRMAGAKVVTYGYINGPTWTTAEQLRGTINENTAAIFHVEAFHGHHRGAMPLREVLGVSKEKNIPVIVDAADNPDLKKYIALGADLVVYSGGKWIQGPQSTGLIAGRKDLVAACEAQSVNLGRPLKVGKEEIIGFMTALELYQKRDWEKYYQAREKRIDRMRMALSGIRYIETRIIKRDERGDPTCMLRIELDEKALGITAPEVIRKLSAGDPSVHIREYYAHIGQIEIQVDPLPEEYDDVLITAVKRTLTSQAK